MSNCEKEMKAKIGTLKKRIFAAKSQLDNVRHIELITHALDPFKRIKYQIAKRIGGKNISNAWLKCFDIIMKFGLLRGRSTVRHYDNASFPGAFILAAKYVVTHYNNNCDYKWRACSLYDPHKSHLEDDYGLFRQFPGNWLMDDCNNGDITDINNINDIAGKLLNRTNFYTSDLGFDVSSDYNNQEILHFCANTGQILLGLKVLQIGGNCIIKHYSYFEEYTLKYLSKFKKLFDQFYFYKPAASKSLNSEIYLVGIGFVGCASPATINLAEDLEHCLSNKVYSLKYEFPLSFVELIWQNMESTIESQIEWLNKVTLIAQEVEAKLRNRDEARDGADAEICVKKTIIEVVSKYKSSPVVIYSADNLFKLTLTKPRAF
jgi:hypothetical protein